MTLAATGEVACLETTHRAGDGSLHEVEFRLFPVTDESDRVVALIPHGRDITDYRRAEQNLATIIESLPDATFVIDRDKRVVAWNRVLEEMTGVPKEEMLGRGDNAYSVPFYGERRPIVADLVWEGAAASDLYDNVERRGDTMLAQVYVPSLYGGRGAHVWVAASLLRDSEGNPSGVIESVRDVTERKQAEGALNTSEAKYRRLFETAKDGILILDADTSEITDVNPFLMEMLGYSRAELLGKKLWDIGLFKDIAASKSAFQTLRQERHVRYENLPLETKEGRSVEVEFVSSAYAVNGRQVIQCSIRDITERHQAEQALRAQEERIRQAYVDVLDAVTGGKLILLTDEALAVELGQPLGGCAPITSPAELAEARRSLLGAIEARFPGRTPGADLLHPVCEAWNNALKHAGGGTYQVFATETRLQVAVTDRGPGIDFRTLPKATLVPGFSTAASLGMGFTIMLQLCERVLLCTRPGLTEVVLEVPLSADCASDLSIPSAERASERATRRSLSRTPLGRPA